MASTFEESHREIVRLVDHFRTNQAAYRGPGYKEAQTRLELIDPMFMSLGWDVGNTQHAAPAYREVEVEASLEVEGHLKAPDYSFRIGREAKFYVEAKKPGVDIKGSAGPAYQLRRYAWTKGLPLSVLTDFEEFAAYDTRKRPSEGDKASAARLLFLGFEEYADRWREVWDVFSKEAVLGGAFDHFAGGARGRGSSLVDVEFLKDMEVWRELLARNFALRNARLSVDDLNDAVQKTIDRVVFLRMAEDRGMEEYGRLQGLAEKDDAYRGLIRLARQADDKYNSGLFDFSRDKLTPGLVLDDKVVRGILLDLYFPHSPYAFNVMPPEILGSVYERFLGKVIRLTAGHQAKVEEKPEVRKAGGVYYTPAYIVDYIVKQTVGAAIAGKSPTQLRGYRVLDMACGSGSFLLGAYQELLDHYLLWYSENSPQKYPKAVYVANPASGYRADPNLPSEPPVLRLTSAERKRILTEHIFGVDIDRQAVEVTKLSLLLKVLEGETDETLGRQMRLIHDRALPDLDRNIQCGNSLIGPDYFSGRLLPDADELKRVNPFDWKAAFPEAIAAGGFDAIIGNPPYVRIQTMKEWAPLEVEVYKSAYKAASSGNYDIYVVFVERGLRLLSQHGRLGFILPHKFFNAQYGEPLRALLSTGKHLAEVVHFGDQQVFTGATTYTCLLFLDKAGTDELQVKKVDDLSAWRGTARATAGTIPAQNITAAEWNFAVGAGAALFEQLSQMPVKLENVTDRIFQGIKTSADKVYIVEERDRKERRVRVYSPERDAEYWLEPDLLHPLVKGGDSRRYSLSRTSRLVLFPYGLYGAAANELIPEATLKTHCPLTHVYLSENRGVLEAREHGEFRGPKWYGYSRNQALEVMPLPKLFTPDIAARAAFSLDETGEVFFTGGVSGGYGILVRPEWSREYVLGLLNSKLLEWMIKQSATQMRGGYYSFESRFIRTLPIRPIDFSDPADKARHDKMVSLVERMLELHKRRQEAASDGERELLQRQIDSTDGEIDALVYELYGLSEEEIRIVEGR